ncbi:MAG: YfiR family protein [Candidatus Competibacteraceae bacterium]|nr:YfiR family protein [Candidatus Competibacteraceae bacterium]
MARRWIAPARLMLLALGLGAAASWAETAEESELKAAYIYRFAQYTTWPDPPSGEVKFCSYGQPAIDEGLRKLQGRTVQNVPISVSRVDSPQAAKICHVLFLHVDRRGELAAWVAALALQPVLVVSDLPDAFREKAMIVFAVEPNRVTFRINLTQARASGLSLSGQMLKLAQEVR